MGISNFIDNSQPLDRIRNRLKQFAFVNHKDCYLKFEGRVVWGPEF